MVLSLAKEPSARLLKHVVRCYLRLSDNPRYYKQHKQAISCILSEYLLFVGQGKHLGSACRISCEIQHSMLVCKKINRRRTGSRNCYRTWKPPPPATCGRSVCRHSPAINFLQSKRKPSFPCMVAFQRSSR